MKIENSEKYIVKYYDGSYKYTICDINMKKNRFYLLIKRIIDLLFSLVMSVLLFIPIMILALVIRIDSKGCPFFKQERLGINKKKFYIYKFRTMYVDAEKNGPQWANKNDERCTRVGKVLRKSRIDEIPQLFNIIKGDMSIVGPRPERECFYNEFKSYIDGFDKRLCVKPGLTGLAQVNGGYDLAPEEKIVFDMQYAENISPSVDLYCCFKTIKLAFTQEGAR